MNGDALVEALRLPKGSRVDQRVPKKLLLENGAPTPTDKRIINEGIEELIWLAALKPATVGVPEYRDDTREYLEIAVLSLVLRDSAKSGRLVELIHRAIPYPLLLVAEHSQQVGLSAANKRWSLGESGKTVLEGSPVVVTWSADGLHEHWAPFSAALALSQQPRTTLLALYQGWVNTLLSLEAARLTGAFQLSTSEEHASARREALTEIDRLNGVITRLRASAAKEKQVPRLVELNLELKRAEAALAAARAQL